MTYSPPWAINRRASPFEDAAPEATAVAPEPVTGPSIATTVRPWIAAPKSASDRLNNPPENTSRDCRSASRAATSPWTRDVTSNASARCAARSSGDAACSRSTASIAGRSSSVKNRSSRPTASSGWPSQYW